MAFIKYVEKEDIPEKYQVADSDNIVNIHSINPKIMAAHYRFYLDLMRRKSPLSRIQREMLALFVSQQNSCSY